MNHRNTVVRIVAAFISVAASFSPALAEREQKIAFAAEVESCIAAVTRNLELSDARRVRHLVTEQDKRGAAYALSIETSVYSDSAVRTYRAHCVARGPGDPLKFRIDELVDR